MPKNVVQRARSSSSSTAIKIRKAYYYQSIADRAAEADRLLRNRNQEYIDTLFARAAAARRRAFRAPVTTPGDAARKAEMLRDWIIEDMMEPSEAEALTSIVNFLRHLAAAENDT